VGVVGVVLAQRLPVVLQGLAQQRLGLRRRPAGQVEQGQVVEQPRQRAVLRGRILAQKPQRLAVERLGGRVVPPPPAQGGPARRGGGGGRGRVPPAPRPPHQFQVAAQQRLGLGGPAQRLVQQRQPVGLLRVLPAVLPRPPPRHLQRLALQRLRPGVLPAGE